MPALRSAICALLALVLTACAGFYRWEPADASRRSAGAASGSLVGPDQYRVSRGDTLYSIAFRHNADFRELAQWNGIGPDYLIFPGQLLRLSPPAGAQTRPVAPPPGGRPQPLPAPASREPAPAAPPSGAPLNWVWPVQGSVTRGYALAQGSKGLDFTAPVGQPVVAAAPGKVVYSGNALRGYGELIIIKHDEVYLSAYGYNRQRLVQEGDFVTAGQPIAEVGLGPENKPLLHFEIRERGKPVNPAGFLPARK
ncbi:MAG: peptidoglycan DD-metalloendopeptidase family protein [Gammaproteobacteria bacterium]